MNMALNCGLLLIFACLLSVFTVLKADRTSLKIYKDVQGDIFCFRRLNATHQIGCASDVNGNIGVLYVANNSRDINAIAEDTPHGQCIVALPVNLFNMGNMTLLKQSKNVKGILILKKPDQSSPKSFSPEQSCPNRNFGLYTESIDETYANCKILEWNKNSENLALGMMYEDWGMPIFLVTNETSIENIIECYKTFNEPDNGSIREWPLCSAQLKSVMLAAKDSETCMRRNKLVTNLNEVKTCDPLSDKNVLTTLFPTNKSESINNRSVIVVAARLDTFSLFDRLAPGAHSSVTGLVTLLSVAHSLAQLRDEILKNLDPAERKNLLFIILNGEAFDYIGSSRIVFDMQKGLFPVELDEHMKDQPALLGLHHISHFIELSQLATSDNSYWVHHDPISEKNKFVSQSVAELFRILQEEANQVSLKVKDVGTNRPLPPASFQNFLRYDLEIPGIVIADHKEKYTNRYYNSLFDTDETLNLPLLTSNLANLSTAVSRTLYHLLTNDSSKKFESNETLVQCLLECYLQNASCNLFREIADPAMTERLRVEPYPLYVSVSSGGHAKANAITLYTRYLLAYLTGNVLMDRVRKNCSGNPKNEIFQYDWMAGTDGNLTGICVKSTVMYTLAQSPAYVLNDWKSSEYSTWTESVWTENSVRIFLQPSRTQEAVTLVIGLIILLLSICTVYFVNKHASIIFNTKPLVGC